MLKGIMMENFLKMLALLQYRSVLIDRRNEIILCDNFKLILLGPILLSD